MGFELPSQAIDVAHARLSRYCIVLVSPSRLVVHRPESKDDDVLTSVIVRDISDRRAQESRITHLAYHDTLTDLPNRTLLMKLAKKA